MAVLINAKALWASLPEVVRRVQKGARFTVIYRSRPAFQIVPIGAVDAATCVLEDDPLYRAEAVGASTDARASADHDDGLYGKRSRCSATPPAGWRAPTRPTRRTLRRARPVMPL